MSKVNVAPQQHRSLLWDFYVITWVGLAGIAICYLSVVANRSDFYAAMSGAVALQAKKTELEQQRRIAVELSGLRDDVKSLKLKLDIAQARLAVPADRQGKDEPATTPSASPYEVSLQQDRPVAHSLPPQTQRPQTQRQAKARADMQTSPGNVDRTEIPPLPERLDLTARVKRAQTLDRDSAAAIALNGERSSPAMTSVAADTIRSMQERQDKTKSDRPIVLFGAPTIVAEVPFPGGSPAHAFAAVIGVATSLDGLRASWRQLSVLYPELLGKLQARYDLVGPPEAKYRLLAGPLPDRAQADELCGLLEMQNINCTVGEFAGKMLEQALAGR